MADQSPCWDSLPCEWLIWHRVIPLGHDDPGRAEAAEHHAREQRRRRNDGAPSPDAAWPPACGGGLLPMELRALRAQSKVSEASPTLMLMHVVLQGEPAGVAGLLGVPRLLDAMRAHFGGAPSQDAARPPACGGGLLPAELRALRQGLLNAALSLLLHCTVPHHKASRVALDDIQVPFSPPFLPYYSPQMWVRLVLACSTSTRAKATWTNTALWSGVHLT